MPNYYVDNVKLNRRELWVYHETKHLFFGWIVAEMIEFQPKDSIWKPHIKFGDIK